MAGTHTAATLIAGAVSLPATPASPRLLEGAVNVVASPAPAAAGHRLLGAVGIAHPWSGGNGKVSIVAEIKSSPSNILVRRRVALLRERDMLCVGELWSDATTGLAVFENVQLGVPYTAIVYDGPRVFRAACQDALFAEPM